MNFNLLKVVEIWLMTSALVSGAKNMSELEHKSGSHVLRKRAIEAGIQTYECLIPGTFAMTFDDGPFIYTRQLIRILKRLEAKATFFVVGENVDNEDFGPVLTQMNENGHQIASHSYSHPHLNTLTDEQIDSEISRTNDAIFKRIGRRINYFRCPYGECDDRVLGRLSKEGYRVINWNMDTLDWTGKSPREILSAYQDGIRNSNTGSNAFISLQHDLHPNTIAVVGQLIKVVRRKGFRLTTVAECMGE